jgi:hypothetical protein
MHIGSEGIWHNSNSRFSLMHSPVRILDRLGRSLRAWGGGDERGRLMELKLPRRTVLQIAALNEAFSAAPAL